jgi:flavin reductase (DIM6/NTAB) family NADH-FMN oxidoreductase RutF
MSAAIAFTPSETNTRQLRDAFGQFATGVTIVTANTPGGVVAITASSFSSVSLDPPMALWSVDKGSSRCDPFTQATEYAIHVLAPEQEELAWAVVKDAHTLRNRPLAVNADGVPVLDSCLARFDCRQAELLEGGDHIIILGHINHVELNRDGDSLTFFQGRMQRLTQAAAE